MKMMFLFWVFCCIRSYCIRVLSPGPEVIKLEYSLKHIIKANDWLRKQQSLRFILSLNMNSSFITSGPGFVLAALLG